MLISDAKIFLTVSNSSSLSAAARQLGIGAMQVSRRLGVLESSLGVRLLHRTTRSISLTNEGAVFLPYAQAMVDANEAARTVLGATGCEVSGVLRLTAPSVFGHTVVIPLLPQLLRRHPALQVDLDLSDRVVDIAGQGHDLALRIAPLVDSELIARPIAPNPRVLCASPTYLERRGRPHRLADLHAHSCISLQAVPRWPFMVEGALQRKTLSGSFSTTSVEAVRTAAVHGLGVAMLTYWDVFEQLRDGSLVQLELEDARMQALSIWALTPTRQHVPARVRVFLDALQGAMASLSAKG